MSNAFSKSYASKIDCEAMAKDSARSRSASQRRDRLMQSDDPKVRAWATGNMGLLSGSKENARIKKSSHLG